MILKNVGWRNKKFESPSGMKQRVPSEVLLTHSQMTKQFYVKQISLLKAQFHSQKQFHFKQLSLA